MRPSMVVSLHLVPTLCLWSFSVVEMLPCEEHKRQFQGLTFYLWGTEAWAAARNRLVRKSLLDVIKLFLKHGSYSHRKQ